MSQFQQSSLWLTQQLCNARHHTLSVVLLCLAEQAVSVCDLRQLTLPPSFCRPTRRITAVSILPARTCHKDMGSYKRAWEIQFLVEQYTDGSADIFSILAILCLVVLNYVSLQC